MPPFLSLAVRPDRFLEELKILFWTAPRCTRNEQVAFANDVFVRAIVVAGHHRLAPAKPVDLLLESSSRGFRYSCRHRRGPTRRSKSNCVWMLSSRGCSAKRRRHARRRAIPRRAQKGRRRGNCQFGSIGFLFMIPTLQGRIGQTLSDRRKKSLQ